MQIKIFLSHTLKAFLIVVLNIDELMLQIETIIYTHIYIYIWEFN